MNLFDTLTELDAVKYNHRMIVHGIHDERKIIPLSLVSYVCATANNRDYFKVARHSVKFPIKDITMNRYNKKLTDEQYSALLTFLLHCRDYSAWAVPATTVVEYKSSTELRYNDEFKTFLDAHVEFAENVYNLGFDTGDISMVTSDKSVRNDIMNYLVTALANTVPDELFAEEATGDVEVIGIAEE